MTSQEIQDKYSKLCTELGDKVLKLLDLKDQHSRVSSEIEELETMVQAYRKVRDELSAAHTAIQVDAAMGHDLVRNAL